MNLATIVGHVGGRCKGQVDEQEAWKDTSIESSEAKAAIDKQVEKLLLFVERKNDKRDFDEVERGLRDDVFAFGRLLLTYFVARREEHSEGSVRKWLRRGFRPRRRERKFLSTFFGRITIWRTYVRRPGGTGLHPLDLELKIPADGFSLLVMGMVARLATLVSYEQVTALMLYFQSWSPSKTTVEKAVLGFGHHTQEWFESAPAPEGDGEVLVIQGDSKATPTATEEELEKRRGKRENKKRPLSPRHRGREKRKRRGAKKRRKKGDKSKNGKAATIITMYTLKKGKDEDGKPALLGPINKRVYASYAPKRHAFAVARREADKRGFTRNSQKKIQIVIDGDEDLATLAKELFPGASVTLDIMHALEYVWEAGRYVYPEGSQELAAWVKRQENLLYKGKASLVMTRIWKLRDEVGDRARERLEQIRTYLGKRLDMMNYDELRKEDLEVASGAVEGAVKHVIGKRFDSGSMRWIRQRAEALLGLRCIEINGDWDAFTEFVQERTLAPARAETSDRRLLTTRPAPLPTFGVAA